MNMTWFLAAVTLLISLLILRFWWSRRNRLVARVALIFFLLSAFSVIGMVAEPIDFPFEILIAYPLGLISWHFIFYLLDRVILHLRQKRALRDTGLDSAGEGKEVWNQTKITIELPDGNRYELKGASTDEVIRLMEKIASPRSGGVDNPAPKPESGKILAELLILGVPALIAIALVATLIYLMVSQAAVDNFEIPEILTNAITTILGYYFGVGASQSLQKGKPITADELHEMLSA